MADVQWIDFGKRLYRAVVALELSYGMAAKQAGVAKATFYRMCCGHAPSGENYVRMLEWLKNSQRRIGRRRAVAAAQRTTRRTRDGKAGFSKPNAGSRPKA